MTDLRHTTLKWMKVILEDQMRSGVMRGMGVVRDLNNQDAIFFF